MAFQFEAMALSGVISIEPQRYQDARGSFCELFKSALFQEHGIPGHFAQINRSVSRQDVLRGLHYQLLPSAQGKLVMVVKGEICDVVVDIRQGSASYGRWLALRLDAQQGRMLYVPEGFAHGFCVLSGEAEVIYCCTAPYVPALERGIIWNDPDLAIDWPVQLPVLSGKDALYPRLRDAENNFSYVPALSEGGQTAE